MPIKSRIRIVPHYCRVTYKMTDAMFYYTKTENCPIPTPTLPLKGREPSSSPFKGEARRGMGVNGATRTANHA